MTIFKTNKIPIRMESRILLLEFQAKRMPNVQWVFVIFYFVNFAVLNPVKCAKSVIIMEMSAVLINILTSHKAYFLHTNPLSYDKVSSD